MNKEKQLMGKRSRAAGGRFETKVRKTLESKGWIICKWMNNLELIKCDNEKGEFSGEIKLVPAKRKYNPFLKALSIGTGFPDFVAFRTISLKEVGITIQSDLDDGEKTEFDPCIIIGVEVKSRGLLSKEEKAKCKWLLDNKIFSKILIASKGEKRGSIKYKEFEVKK